MTVEAALHIAEKNKTKKGELECALSVLANHIKFLRAEVAAWQKLSDMQYEKTILPNVGDSNNDKARNNH
jgi:hypothetical protein